MSDNITNIANALLAARASGKALTAADFADQLQTPDQAYQVQEMVAQALDWHGSGVGAAWKSGGASRDSLITHAALPPAGVWRSPANAGNWPLHQRGIEAEIAVRLGCDVTPDMAHNAHHSDAQQWVESMTTAIEVVSTRWDQGFDAPALLKLADLQAHGALVLGPWQPWQDLDWAQQRLHIAVNGVQVEHRQGTHPLQHPTWGLATFAQHATRQGHTLPAGTVVTTGSWNGMYLAKAGDLVEVIFDGVGSASVQL